MTVYVRAPYKRFPQLMRHPRLISESRMKENRVFIPVDIQEDDDKYILTAVLPGLKPDEIGIEVKDKTVRVKGEYPDNTDEGNTYFIRERGYGKFVRSFTLPVELNASKTEAKMENGLLKVNIPKAEEAKPKTIKVSVK